MSDRVERELDASSKKIRVKNGFDTFGTLDIVEVGIDSLTTSPYTSSLMFRRLSRVNQERRKK